MDDRVRVPSIGRHSVERLSGQPLAAERNALVHQPNIETREDGPAVGELRILIRHRPNSAHPDDERSLEALKAKDGIDVGAALCRPDVGRRSDAGFESQLRYADDHICPVLEKVVRESEVAIVANEGRSKESDVPLIAAARDAKWCAVSTA